MKIASPRAAAENGMRRLISVAMLTVAALLGIVRRTMGDCVVRVVNGLLPNRFLSLPAPAARPRYHTRSDAACSSEAQRKTTVRGWSTSEHEQSLQAKLTCIHRDPSECQSRTRCIVVRSLTVRSRWRKVGTSSKIDLQHNVDNAHKTKHSTPIDASRLVAPSPPSASILIAVGTLREGGL